MAVAMLIGLWLCDELSFDRQFTHYDRLAKIWQFVKFDVKKSAYDVILVPLAGELRSNYPDFEVVSVSASRDVILANGDTTAMILNKAAVKLMGIKNPIGEVIRRGGRDYTMVGVINDMVKENPFEPVNPFFSPSATRMLTPST